MGNTEELDQNQEEYEQVKEEEDVQGYVTKSIESAESSYITVRCSWLKDRRVLTRESKVFRY